jgi:hypothetical protein
MKRAAGMKSPAPSPTSWHCASAWTRVGCSTSRSLLRTAAAAAWTRSLERWRPTPRSNGPSAPWAAITREPREPARQSGRRECRRGLRRITRPTATPRALAAGGACWCRTWAGSCRPPSAGTCWAASLEAWTTIPTGVSPLDPYALPPRPQQRARPCAARCGGAGESEQHACFLTRTGVA